MLTDTKISATIDSRCHFLSPHVSERCPLIQHPTWGIRGPHVSETMLTDTTWFGMRDCSLTTVEWGVVRIFVNRIFFFFFDFLWSILLVILVPRRGGYVTFCGWVQVLPPPHVNNEHSLGAKCHFLQCRYYNVPFELICRGSIGMLFAGKLFMWKYISGHLAQFCEQQPIFDAWGIHDCENTREIRHVCKPLFLHYATFNKHLWYMYSRKLANAGKSIFDLAILSHLHCVAALPISMYRSSEEL